MDYFNPFVLILMITAHTVTVNYYNILRCVFIFQVETHNMIRCISMLFSDRYCRAKKKQKTDALNFLLNVLAGFRVQLWNGFVGEIFAGSEYPVSWIQAAF